MQAPDTADPQRRTPLERLEERKRLLDCRTCNWLATLSPEDREAWQKAIKDERFGGALVASEINLEIGASNFTGPTIGEQSVLTHRQRNH